MYADISILTLAFLLICTLLNGCFNEFPALHIIYSGGCFAYGNSRNNNSYQTVLKKKKNTNSFINFFFSLAKSFTQMHKHLFEVYIVKVIVHYVDQVYVSVQVLNN